MKRIKLTLGQFAIVDDKDFKRFGHLKWTASKSSKTFYAYRQVKCKTFYLHREIMGVTDPRVKVDHKNHNGLDCRRSNLRPCTNAQNMANRSSLDAKNKSGHRGVCWDSQRKKWRADLQSNGKRVKIGRFKEKTDAINAYVAANRNYFGEFGGVLS